MHDFPRFNKVAVAAGRISGFDESARPGSLAFTGLYVIEPKVLSDIAVGVFSSIIDHYRLLLRQGLIIRSHDVTGTFWTDMGTAADYLALHAGLLRREIPCWPELALPPGQQLIDDQAEIANNCRLGNSPSDWLAIGAARISGGALLERAVVWDDVTIIGGIWRDCLISSSREEGGS
jgi:NDP-sugar pyrophosphorylase family protein